MVSNYCPKQWRNETPEHQRTTNSGSSISRQGDRKLRALQKVALFDDLHIDLQTHWQLGSQQQASAARQGPVQDSASIPAYKPCKEAVPKSKRGQPSRKKTNFELKNNLLKQPETSLGRAIRTPTKPNNSHRKKKTKQLNQNQNQTEPKKNKNGRLNLTKPSKRPPHKK